MLKSIAALPLSAFFREGWLPLTYRDGKPILTINGVEHDAEELMRKSEANGAVKVKPLEWIALTAARSNEDPTHEETGDYEAVTPFGCYSIQQYFGSDSYGWQATFDFNIIADKDDPDDAKAAAQADYEQRIRSALVGGGDDTI